MNTVNIETLSGGGLVTDLDGGEESKLAHNLLALDELELGILIAWVYLDARLEVPEGILGLENGGIGSSAAVVCLCGYNICCQLLF